MLTGTGGNDTLNGGTGADTMIGGVGNDTYVTDTAADIITENPNEGTDTVQSMFTYTLGTHFENLLLLGSATVNGTGNSSNNVITGNAAVNTLTGGAGNDTLNGAAGDDQLIGGSGNDVYVIDTPGDVVTEFANEGVDAVQSYVTYTLGAEVENLTLLGTAAVNGTGNAVANVLIGNAAANTLTGAAGNDTLNGGAGADIMWGGQGNDVYVIDHINDQFVEYVNEGIDTVQSSVSHTLGFNVENLTLTGTAAINGTGNFSDNSITGNAGVNALYGSYGNDALSGGAGNDSLDGGAGDDTLDGGAGADTMNGGSGSDTYVIDNAGDLIIEQPAWFEPNHIRSSITHALGAAFRNLTLTGSAAINGTGNASDNTIIGNTADNVLNGGDGTDTLRGGAGNDLYILDAIRATVTNLTGYCVIDVLTDAVVENSNDGIDSVTSSASYTLPANVEHLTFTDTAKTKWQTLMQSTGYTIVYNIDQYERWQYVDGYGNATSNMLRGGLANEWLDGAGGNDVLQGMAGNDTLDDASGSNLLDAGAGNDTIHSRAGRGFVVGGQGNDLIWSYSGQDVIAFNKGEGQDLVIALGAGTTLSIGGGIRYADMTFTRRNMDLELNLGSSGDRMTLSGWYRASPSRNILNMQVIADAMAEFNAASSDKLLNKKVANFDFLGLANAFDAAGAPANWALTNALLSKHLSGSDTAALGGDLAYRYGKAGTLAGMGFDPVQGILANTSFGAAAQALQATAVTDTGLKRLS